MGTVFAAGTIWSKSLSTITKVDGWESQCRRDGGHDHAVVQPVGRGRLPGVNVDTRHPTGNIPKRPVRSSIARANESTPPPLGGGGGGPANDRTPSPMSIMRRRSTPIA
ncbi:hypothetical protein [Pseudoruegeria haliotis]|uniref:hypothetical protein n=1 Tax=Aliiruegeria haliotis TaxID=1280846 RepID=UPI000D069D5B